MKLLVIDDEPLVGKTLARLLRPHDVDVIGSSTEALEAIGRGEFELVFCDLKMPELSGPELYEQAIERVPELRERFVFITGGAAQGSAQDFLAAHKGRVLYKPFRRHELKALLEAVGAVGSEGG